MSYFHQQNQPHQRSPQYHQLPPSMINAMRAQQRSPTSPYTNTAATPTTSHQQRQLRYQQQQQQQQQQSPHNNNYYSMQQYAAQQSYQQAQPQPPLSLDMHSNTTRSPYPQTQTQPATQTQIQIQPRSPSPSSTPNPIHTHATMNKSAPKVPVPAPVYSSSNDSNHEQHTPQSQRSRFSPPIDAFPDTLPVLDEQNDHSFNMIHPPLITNYSSAESKSKSKREADEVEEEEDAEPIPSDQKLSSSSSSDSLHRLIERDTETASERAFLHQLSQIVLDETNQTNEKIVSDLTEIDEQMQLETTKTRSPHISRSSSHPLQINMKAPLISSLVTRYKKSGSASIGTSPLTSPIVSSSHMMASPPRIKMPNAHNMISYSSTTTTPVTGAAAHNHTRNIAKTNDNNNITNLNPIKFSIFAQKDLICTTNDPNNCLQSQRIIEALKYYESSDPDKFCTFICEEYNHFLDDIIHFKENHMREINQIASIHNKCDPMHCQFISIRRNSAHKKSNDINENAFIEQEWNEVHFILHHMLELGWRGRGGIDEKTDNNEDEYKFAEDMRIKYVDFFSRITPKNKFTLEIDNTNNQQTTANATDLDDICTKLSLLRVTDQLSLQKFVSFINEQEYDTDSIKDDIGVVGNNSSSNILAGGVAKKIDLQHIMFDIKMPDNTFSEGICFEYHGNKNNEAHTGNIIHVTRKYDSFKAEISNYSHIAMNEYKTLAIVKAKRFMKTNRVKAMKCRLEFDEYGYGINADAPVQYGHILSLILYCDFTNLSTHFSATFRRSDRQNIADIGENSEYYFLGRNLRELVVYYGMGTNDTYIDDAKTREFSARGPFFCGVSLVLAMPSICIRLFGPTSTSMHIEVAINFSKRAGMIIEFDYEKQGGNFDEPSFDASWISI